MNADKRKDAAEEKDDHREIGGEKEGEHAKNPEQYFSLRPAFIGRSVVQFDEAQVAHIGFLNGVKHIAQDQEGSHQRFDRYVSQHAQKKAFGQSEQCGLVHDVQRKCRGKHIAETGNETDDRIDPYAEAAWEYDALVEQVAEKAQVVGRLLTRAALLFGNAEDSVATSRIVRALSCGFPEKT